MRRRLWLPLMLLLGAGLGLALLSLLRRTPTPSAEVPAPASVTPLPAQVPEAEGTAAVPTDAPPEAPLTPAPDSAPNPEGSQTPGPTPLVLPGYFVTVEPGDTLWAIAIDSNIPMEAIIEANPAINPDVLYPGERLLIPDPASPLVQVAPGTGPTPELMAYVSTEGVALNLRSSPEEGLNVVTVLQPATPLNVVGRTADGAWLQVVTADGQRGWVMTQWVTLRVDLAAIPVGGPGAVQPTAVAQTVPSATPLALPQPPTARPGAATPLPQAPGQPLDYPYISGVTEHARAVFLRGRSLGNRSDVFSKVGDSITVASAFLTPIGRGDYNLRDYAYLGPVVDYYSQTIARDANSFANTSLAAKGGWSAWTVLNPAAANPNYCLEGELPLVCEYRLVRPAIALIMLGTNDVPTTNAEAYEGWLRQTVEISLDMGVIPVLSTIPEFHRSNVEGRVALLNGIITDLAREYDVPLWDYHAALQGLPNDGLSSDGVHPSWTPSPSATDFTPQSLQTGMAVRNLTALQALDAVWRGAIR